MKKLLYCPMLYRHDKGMWPPAISSTSYFLWQKGLWDIFKELKGWKVLWNAGQPNSNLYDPIQKWRADNIKYTRMKVGDALRNCDMVLVDVPSTVMWDARKAGKPCLCITWDRRWIREDIFDLEKCPSLGIWFCSDPDEIRRALELWLGGFLSTVKNTALELHFVVNRNDWLKEVVG